MKNYLLTLFIFSIFKTQGQEKKIPYVTYGLGVGINSSVFRMPDNTSYLEFCNNYTSKLGYNLSLRVRAKLFPRVYVESGLSYFVKNSEAKEYELVTERSDYIFKDNQLYSFTGRLSRKSDIIQQSFQIPIQLNIAILDREKYSLEIFGGVFKDFGIKMRNNVDIKTEITPKLADNTLNELMLTKFVEVSKGRNTPTFTLYRNIETNPDGIGFQYGVAAHFQKFGLEISANRPEDTLGAGTIYRAHSISINIQYFLK
jgi:hypothetical protein